MKYLNDVSYKDCVGRVFKSKSSGDFKIVKYNNALMNYQVEITDWLKLRRKWNGSSRNSKLKTKTILLQRN